MEGSSGGSDLEEEDGEGGGGEFDAMEGGNDGGEDYRNPVQKCGTGSESDSCRFNCDCETLIHFSKSLKYIYID